MPYTPNSVISYGFPFNDSAFTYNLAAGTVIGDIGKAVELDTTGTNQVKLATNNGRIFGRLISFEDRTQTGGGLVGTVERRFKAKFTAIAAHGITVGTSATGGTTLGQVKLATAQDLNANVCVELIDATTVVLERI